MSIAVIKTGGKQYIVKEGDTLKVELIREAKKIEMADLLNGKKVTAEVLGTGRFPKVRILKFHAKKHYKRNTGHVQNFSQIKIESIK